ncbi:MAG: RnfABCDGE type electron transport complex subunit G [Rikenellaceae bacterium]|nr:RnfABCDGE type electron transport complex subunit G [Rikenellaceae bacterium]
MESTLKNMVLVLFLITLFASGAVAVVNQLTEEPIAEAKAAKTSGAIGEVVPPFDNDIAATATPVEIDGGTATLYTAQQGAKPVGYAVQSFTTNGFSGLITLMVGFLPDGTIQGIQVLSHAETPGLGSKITEAGNPLTASFEGKNPAELKMTVRKDGGDIDAITASTITSRAYTEAVQRAYDVFLSEVYGVEFSSPQIYGVDPYRTVFPEYTNDPASEMVTVQVDGNSMQVFPVKKEHELLGYMVYSAAEGYKSTIDLLVGFAPDGTILDILVTGQDETPGYGTDILLEDNPLLTSLKGKKAAELDIRLQADGGDVQAISGATGSSEGYTRGVNAAYRAFQQVK